jgi:MFS family permease
MSITLSGLIFGLVLGRVLGGIMANFASWRDTYWLAVGLQGGEWEGESRMSLGRTFVAPSPLRRSPHSLLPSIPPPLDVGVTFYLRAMLIPDFVPALLVLAWLALPDTPDKDIGLSYFQVVSRP